MKKLHTVTTAMIAGVSLMFAGAAMADPGGARHGFGHGMERGQGHAHGQDAGHDHDCDHEQGEGHRHGQGAAGASGHAAMAGTRLDDMKARLKITPAQETAWQAFAAAARQQSEGMQAMHSKMQAGSGSAPERMAQHAAAMQERGAAMATMANAYKSLYAVLTPEQKAQADQRPAMMGRGMHQGHGPRGS